MARYNPLPPVPSLSSWDQELTTIQELLSGEPECRLVTLVGQARTSNAWLARRTLKRLRSAFLDGTYAIRLATLPSADLLPRAIAAGVGLRLPAHGVPEASLLDGLRTKEMLLLLEGFGHLLPEVGLIEDLLLDAPGIKLLVTSSVRLNLRAEWVRQTDRLGLDFARGTVWRTGAARSCGSLAWGRGFLQADGGWVRDTLVLDRQSALETLAQTSQPADTAG